MFFSKYSNTLQFFFLVFFTIGGVAHACVPIIHCVHRMLPWKLFRPPLAWSMGLLLIASSVIASRKSHTLPADQREATKAQNTTTPFERFVRSRIFEPRVMAFVNMFQGARACVWMCELDGVAHSCALASTVLFCYPVSERSFCPKPDDVPRAIAFDVVRHEVVVLYDDRTVIFDYDGKQLRMFEPQSMCNGWSLQVDRKLSFATIANDVKARSLTRLGVNS